MEQKLLTWALGIQKEAQRRALRSQSIGIPDCENAALNPLAGEIVGHRFARLLEIGTAPSVRVVSLAEARQADRRKWIAKVVASDGRLKWASGFGVPGASALLVGKIPGAITLYYLREFYGVADPISPDGWSYGVKFSSALDRVWWGQRIRFPDRDANAERRAVIDQVIYGKDSIPNAREFYSDFRPPKDWTPVRRAIAQNSNAMLLIHAARLFLGASTAHHSNVLVDASGCLYAIDFESCARTDAAEIGLTFEHVAPGTRAHTALGGVARLREDQLAALFDDLPGCPGWPEWPLGSKAKTITHYLDRLLRWKAGFSKKT